MSLLAAAIGTIVAVMVLAATRAKPGTRDHALLNTEETQFYELEGVQALARLRDPGQFVVKVFRQSGNPYKDDQQYSSAASAVKAMLSTFRRAKVDTVVVMFNTEDEFSLRRGWKCHRGHHEGKKLGWIEIHRLPGAAPAAPPRGVALDEWRG